MNKFSKACLAAAQTLVDLKGDIWVSGISSGCYITSKGERKNGTSYGKGDVDKPYGLTGCVCHHFMLRYAGEAEPFLFVNVMKTSKMLKAQVESGAAEAFVRFMCQQSPVRNFIVNGDKMDELMNGGVIIDCLAAGYPATVWTAKTLRILYEETHRVDVWFKLAQKGVNPMLALCYAMSVTARGTLMTGDTHNSTMVPCSKKNIKELFVDHLPVSKEWGPVDKVSTARVFASDQPNNNYGTKWPDNTILPVGAAGPGKKVKVPDGWGGYTEKVVGGGEEALAEALIELQKEYA